MAGTNVAVAVAAGVPRRVNAHDVDTLISFFADHCVFDMPRVPLQRASPDRPGGVRVGSSHGTRGPRYRVRRLQPLELRRSRRGVNDPRQLTGVPIEVRECDLFEFTDGKISRKGSFWKIDE